MEQMNEGSSIAKKEEEATAYEVTNGGRDRGRYLVARKTIAKNEVVLEDVAHVVGPFTVSMPLCLNCHASPLTLQGARECSGGCGYQLCKECCCQLQPSHEQEDHQQHPPLEKGLLRQQQQHYHRIECQILANAIQKGTFS